METKNTETSTETAGYNRALLAQWKKDHGTDCLELVRKRNEAEQECERVRAEKAFSDKSLLWRIFFPSFAVSTILLVTLDIPVGAGLLLCLLIIAYFALNCLALVLMYVVGGRLSRTKRDAYNEKVRAATTVLRSAAEAAYHADAFLADLVVLRKIMGSASDRKEIAELKAKAELYMLCQAQGIEDLWRTETQSFLPDRQRGGQILKEFMERCQALSRINLLENSWARLLRSARDNLDAGRPCPLPHPFF